MNLVITIRMAVDRQHDHWCHFNSAKKKKHPKKIFLLRIFVVLPYILRLLRFTLAGGHAATLLITTQGRINNHIEPKRTQFQAIKQTFSGAMSYVVGSN
jgi:hypothetical protein